MQTKNTKQGGFTLVEIAIVLVIIGLLLGGILKGQELINNAKVRSVADRQNSLKAAWFGFVDRYNFIPGDSKRAVQLVPGAKSRTDSDGSGDGRLAFGESVLTMQQLTGAGFLRCPQCNGDGNPNNTTEDATTDAIPDAENSLINQYSGVMSIWNESGLYAYQRIGSATTAPTTGRLQIHSGPRIPSNILSEVDRKIDDGIANSGDMVFNELDPSDPVGLTSASIGVVATTAPNKPSFAQCMNSVGTDLKYANPGELVSIEKFLWRTADANPAVENNCGASVFI